MVEPEREIEHLQAELRRQQQHTALLRDVAIASRSRDDPQHVFRAIYERIKPVLPVDVFFVALCDSDEANAYHFALFIDDEQTVELADRRFGGLTGHILAHKQPLLFRDVYQEYQQQGVGSVIRFGQLEKRVRAWIGVPILTGRSVIGVLSIQSYQAGVYDQHDLELVQELADLTAIAIENALLYQAQDELSQSLAARVTARSEELAVLTAIAISFSQGQPIGILLDEVLERVLWLLGMSAGAIYLHEQRAMLHRVAWRAEDERQSSAEWLPLDGESYEARALADEHIVDTIAPEQAMVVAPLRAFGHTIGVMTLHGPPRDLTEHERTLVEAASYQIAVGIENARLLDERERQIAQLEALTNIAAASSSSLEPRAILQHVVVILGSLLPIDGFLAATYDRAHDALGAGLSWNGELAEQPLAQVPLDGSRVGQVLREQTPLWLRHTDPQHYELPVKQGWEQGAMSWLGVPLLNREGRAIGVLAIQSRRPDSFDRRDQRFLSAVAHQLALDLENAQLYQAARATAAIAEQRAENLTLVHSISRLVNSSLNPQEVLGIASEQLVKLFNVDHCGIAIYTSEGWNGEIVAEYPPLGSLHQRVNFTNVEDFQQDVQSLGQPIYIADAYHDQRSGPIRELMRRMGMYSLLIVPLISRGRAVGAIGLNSRQPDRRYTPEELELCRTIAAQVAIALENARLFELSVTRLEQEMEIARSIQANLFPSQLPTIPGAKLAARCVPARATGGDFYDVLPLGNDRFGLSIGDVSGKSLPAAMLMAVARSIVRSEALDHDLPEDVMCQANALVAQDVPPDTYVALCYAVYDARQRSLDLALGGQLTPLVRRSDGGIAFIEAEGDLPLGIVPDVQYKTQTVMLHRGDTVLFYTDGLVEAFSPQREMFGFERLTHALAECGADTPGEIVAHLLATVQAWEDGVERHDDVTAVVLHIT